jgi:hypothetical protein
MAQPALARIDNAVCLAAAEVAWRVAEGTASAEEIAATDGALGAAYDEGVIATSEYLHAPERLWLPLRMINVLALLFSDPFGAARNLIVPQQIFSPGPPIALLTSDELGNCCRLIREIFGDRGGVPPHPHWQDVWRTDTAVTLARQMYESREFGAMPILADALQDAGCDSPDILNHCRDTSATHVRGCWVVDLVLGKV